MICAINPTCPREQGENANYMNRNKLTKKKKKKGCWGVRKKTKRYWNYLGCITSLITPASGLATSIVTYWKINITSIRKYDSFHMK